MAKKSRKARYNEDSRDGSGPFWGHTEGLFDQDEDIYGEKYDLATGRPYNNSVDTLESQGLNEQSSYDASDDNDRDVEIIDQHFRKLAKGLADAAGSPKRLKDDSA